MHVLIVQFQIKPEFLEKFIEAVLEDAHDSNFNEPGCLRFDAVQDLEDPNKFYLYEVYKDAVAFEAHRGMPHFKKYAETTKDMHAAPVVRMLGKNLYPNDGAWR